MNDFFIRTNKQLSERNKTLQKIKKILDDLKIIFFLEGGALLGAIRNKNFIKWDHDVEVGVFSDRINNEKILKILNKAHNSKLKIDFVDSRTNNLKINLREHDHTKFSILGFKETKKNLERDMYKYPSKFFSPLDNINFLGKNYRIPNNVKDFLKWTYGDWQTEVKSRDIRVYYDAKAINSIFKIYIKKIIPRIKSFINKKRDQISLRDLFKKRESLFQSMINSNQDKINVLFFDIGSKDANESIFFLRKNEFIKSIIIEPEKKNIRTIKKNLINYKTYRKRFKIINTGVSDKNRKQNQISFRKLDYFLKKYNKNNHLVLKMDLEGRETNVLKGAIKYLKKIKNISIVIKLNPVKYTNKDMYNVLKELFINGYKIKFVESETNVIPGEFKKNGLLLIEVMGDRGLYKNVDKNYILKNAFKPSFKLINFRPGFTSNCIHSIMIEK
tara:strand:+ start:346 stop:1677 length:1332 start_codon:yes stop_codon:yes gene_type:complete